MNLQLLNGYGHVIGALHIDRPLTDRLASDLFAFDPKLQTIEASPDGYTGKLIWQRPAHCGLAMLRMTA